MASELGFETLTRARWPSVRLRRPSNRMVALAAYGLLAVLVVPVRGGGIWLQVAQLGVLAGIPTAFLVAMHRGGFAQAGELHQLAAQLGSDRTRPALADALADALGDPSIELAFWVPEQHAYVDREGSAVTLPTPGSDRAAVEVDGVGAVIYDTVRIPDPELVRAAGGVIAIALDNERLIADQRASREALRASRARIVEAADDERRRIARDLHDGLQARLVLLAIRANGVRVGATASPGVHAQALELETGLQVAIAELRELVQGVMPAALTERGLFAAAEDLIDHVPIPTELDVSRNDVPLPAALESTGYFVLSEAIANAVKHSRARELAVRLEQVDGHLEIEVCDDGVGGAHDSGGSGLRGMADRVDAFGGRLLVDGPPGGGTRVLVQLPYA